MNFKIIKVVRKQGFVDKVVVLVDNELELTFRFINRRAKVVSRIIYGGTRLYDNSKLFVSHRVFKKIIKQVNGIFWESETKKDYQIKLFKN